MLNLIEFLGAVALLWLAGCSTVGTPLSDSEMQAHKLKKPGTVIECKGPPGGARECGKYVCVESADGALKCSKFQPSAAELADFDARNRKSEMQSAAMFKAMGVGKFTPAEIEAKE